MRGSVEFLASISQRLQHPVVAYDHLGFGKSTARTDTPSPFFVTEEAEIYFPAIYEYLRSERFDLWEHSVGRGMAVAIAAHMPHACRSMITEASQAFVEEHTLEVIRAAKASFADPTQMEKLCWYHGDKATWVLATLLPQVLSPLLAIHGDRDEYGSLKFPETIVRLAGGNRGSLFWKIAGICINIT